MDTIAFIQHTVGMTGEIFTPLAEDLRDSPMHRAYPSGNHAMWCVGHMAYADGHLNWLIFGDPNPQAGWADLFQAGTSPQDDSSAYPTYGQVLQAFATTRANWIERIGQLAASDLGNPCAHAPEGFDAFFGTWGKALAALSFHAMHHRGQLADIRRSLGRGPLFA